jgi:hypothetical protein
MQVESMSDIRLCYRFWLVRVTCTLPTVTCQSITAPLCLLILAPPQLLRLGSSPSQARASFVAVSLAAPGSIGWGRLVLALGDAPSVLLPLPSNRHQAGLKSKVFCRCVALIFILVPALYTPALVEVPCRPRRSPPSDHDSIKTDASGAS